MKKCKIGFIYGSFDMFSVRDINAIELAKEECETLVVGVYSDELYQFYNKKQPVIPCKDRMVIANAIRGVDCVIEIKDEKQLDQLIEAGEVDNNQQVRNEFKSVIKQELLKEPEQEGNKKYKTGFIQGTFDMFHYGHYKLIQRAQGVCENLIVGVNSDELVKTYKNKTPIVSAENRIKVIESIKGVSQVVCMEDRDKIKAAKDLNFDALIMGDDWQNTDFYNEMEEKLKKIGVETVYFPYTQGISSTNLRKKIGRDADGNKLVEGVSK